MPNHVTTRCRIIGTAERIVAFKEKHIRPEAERENSDPCLDFNTVVPMPEVISQEGISNNVGWALFAMDKQLNYRFDVANPLGYEWVKELGITTREEFKAWLERERPKAFEEAERAIKAQEETGYPDWYEWSMANWGTKWNSYGFRIVMDTTAETLLKESKMLGDVARIVRGASTDKDVLEFLFETAWSTPDPVFDKLAEMWTDLAFEYVSFDEGWNFAQVGMMKFGQHAYKEVPANEELYRFVYGEASENPEEFAAAIETTLKLEAQS